MARRPPPPQGKQIYTDRPGFRFVDSLDAIFGAHWDHEPTPNPSQEGNLKDADQRLLPSWGGSRVGRFMDRRRGRNTETSRSTASPESPALIFELTAPATVLLHL